MKAPWNVLWLCWLVAGCSATLDWDPEGLRCDNQNPCTEGYSCRATECVSEHSLAKNETCTDDIQCDYQYICSPEKN